MNADWIVSLAIIGVSALILHIKSHVKFIALGLFVGLVLAETLSLPLYEYLAPRFMWLNRPFTLNIFQLTLLLVPTIILGINHAVDKKRFGLIKTVIYVVITTLFLLASILSFLPGDVIQKIQSRSLIAFELVYFRNWLVVLTAIVVVVDSFHHKRIGGVPAKKDKKKY